MKNNILYGISGENVPGNAAVAPAKGYSFGVSRHGADYRFAFTSGKDRIYLKLYSKISDKPDYTIELDRKIKNGDVFSFYVKGLNLDGFFYVYSDGEKNITDPYAERIVTKTASDGTTQRYGVICSDDYDWKDDCPPMIPGTELIIYKLHVRGFTKSRYSKVTDKGTFRGLQEKIPYLADLGINAVELMPSYEFINSGIRPNYWGYDGGFYFAPKGSYCSTYGKLKDYTSEVKDTVRKFHENGIEVYMEFFFPDGTRTGLVVDCLRYWKDRYHIDGFHIICDRHAQSAVADDCFLSGAKLFCTDWNGIAPGKNHFEYNDGFQTVARKLLKGDEDQLQSFLYAMRKHGENAVSVNYIASNNGFTLADVFSYDRKHNEENGENNRDGLDYNLSWNCGVEGPTRRRKVNELRLKLMKNAMVMMMTAQGVPLIYAGDEFGNSQNGNNNAYCQDNETGWTNWNELNHFRKFREFVKELISFRKKHKVLHFDREPYLMDYRYLGFPDVSYHGARAWYPDLEHYNRHVGIMFCGAYGESDENIYVAFNMHWEKHELALPGEKTRKWHIVFESDTPEGVEINDDSTVVLPERTAAILADDGTKNEKAKKTVEIVKRIV